MNIDEASGRALDALVARHVFGLLVEPTVNAKSREPEALYRLPLGDWVFVPFYSSLFSESLKVKEKLQDQCWSLMPERRGNLRGAPVDARILLAHRDGRIVSATGRSFSEALCRTALKAVRCKET